MVDGGGDFPGKLERGKRSSILQSFINLIVRSAKTCDFCHAVEARSNSSQINLNLRFHQCEQKVSSLSI